MQNVEQIIIAPPLKLRAIAAKVEQGAKAVQDALWTIGEKIEINNEINRKLHTLKTSAQGLVIEAMQRREIGVWHPSDEEIKEMHKRLLKKR